MEIFRELFIRGDAGQLIATVEEMERSLPANWVRDKAAESRMQAFAISGKPTYCFISDDDGPLPAAAVFITEKAPGTLYVSNITPLTKDRLVYGEYNAILEDFCNSVVRPATEKAGSTFELTSNQVDLTHWLSANAAKKLRAFSALANKSTGSSHPLDQERWIDFIVTAHREGRTLDASTLRRWLIEIEKWSPEVADQLAIEYEFGGDVLSFYDGRRQGA